MSDIPFKPMPGGPSAETPALFVAAIPDPGDQRLILNWLQGMEHGLGVDSSFISDGPKLSHIALLYPLDVLASLAKHDGKPRGECIERMQAAGFIVNAYSHHGVDSLLIGYPIAEALRLATVWRDDSARDDLETISIIVKTPRGVISGHIEPL
jgi:hypothetical protein